MHCLNCLSVLVIFVIVFPLCYFYTERCLYPDPNGIEADFGYSTYGVQTIQNISFSEQHTEIFMIYTLIFVINAFSSPKYAAPILLMK